MVVLGWKVRDRVSGVEGIVMARAEYLTGCAHVGIYNGLDDKGQDRGYYWVNEIRVEIISQDDISFLVRPVGSRSPAGGPEQSPPAV